MRCEAWGMFLKSAKEPGEKRSHGWSIAARLTLHYTVSAMVILTVIAGVLYWDVADNLKNRKESYISDEIGMLQNMLREPDSEAKLKSELSLEHQVRRRFRHYVRVLDEGGNTLLQNPGMDLIIPAGAFPAPTSDYRDQKAQVIKSVENGRSYILRAVRAEIRGFNGKASVLQIAMDVTSLETYLNQFRSKLAGLLLLGAAVSAVAGGVVARRGLLPLSRMTKTVQKITVHRLNERIAPEHWPSDLTAFALAFDSMLDRLEDSFAGLSHYTGNLAHELRTPINNLMVEADVALSRTRTPEEYQRVLGSNMEEYARLSRMIDSLLFLARADHAQSGFSPATIEAAGEISEVLEFYSAVAQDCGVRVTCRGTALMQGDPVLFRRAVSNLVSNALKYTPQGGEVVISAREEENGSVAVEVNDNGYGIDAEDLPKIYDRFFRVASMRQIDPQGSGLGLSIVKAIMDLHGGRVDITSRLGKGTSALLTFPPASGAAGRRNGSC